MQGFSVRRCSQLGQWAGIHNSQEPKTKPLTFLIYDAFIFFFTLQIWPERF